MPMSLALRNRLPSIDWRQFKELPENNDASLDVVALQRKHDRGRDNPLRWQCGVFRCPKDARPEQYMHIRDEAVKVFIGVMEKTGWRLRGRIKVDAGPFPAMEPGSNKPQLDMNEYMVRAVFEKENVKPVRILLPDSAQRRIILP